MDDVEWIRIAKRLPTASRRWVHLRRSRSPKLLPTAYDDLWRSTQRNWKEQRRTKYKIKKIPAFNTDKPPVPNAETIAAIAELG